jgi:hypothetical protein
MTAFFVFCFDVKIAKQGWQNTTTLDERIDHVSEALLAARGRVNRVGYLNHGRSYLLFEHWKDGQFQFCILEKDLNAIHQMKSFSNNIHIS